jgi:hypothetical protein
MLPLAMVVSAGPVPVNESPSGEVEARACVWGTWAECHDYFIKTCPLTCSSGRPEERLRCTSQCINDATSNCQEWC